MSRRDIYKKPALLRTLITSDINNTDEDYQMYSDAKKDVEINLEKYQENREFYEIVKEMIFDIDEDGKPMLDLICYTFNSSYNSLEVAALLSLVSDKTKNNLDKDIRHELAMSIIYNIPVFPNNKNVEEKLSEYYSQLYKYGFELMDDNDELKTYQLTESIMPDFEKIENDTLSNIIPRTYSSGEINFYKSKIMERLQYLDNAQYAITNLKDGINKLSDLLNSSVRNENNLQKCLTDYPILFGPEYVRVSDKHSFGSEYEADYVLERYSGLYDIIEIEASTLSIYTKQGNPSSALVHAEQQIMDWLEWIEHNNSYAREKVQELYSPKGYVVIGRSNTLLSENKEKLRRRNIVFRDKIEIITYDDLLSKAKALLNILVGNKN